MKKISKKIALLLCLLLAFIAFAGCGQKQNTDTQDEEKTKISIGCMPLNEEAVQVVKELMADKGYEMEVMVFDGNNLPAEALMADEIDCLLLNHLPWMNNFNEQNGSELTLVKGFTYASLFGIYSAKHDSIEDIPENGTIIVSNDPANMHRSLLFMQKLGLMKLGEQNGDYYTVLDITENPKNLQIVEVETTNTAGSFQDADASISFSSVMRNAGIDAHSYLAEDGEYVNYPTGFFVNKGDEESAWAKALIEVTNTEDFQKKFDEIFQGAYMIFDYEG